jgi:hypothetical protein
MHFSLKDFLQLIRVLKKFKAFASHLEQEEELKENSTEFDFLWKKEEPQPIPQNPEPIVEVPQIKITPGCLIDPSKLGLLKKWFDERLAELNRIYKGTEH